MDKIKNIVLDTVNFDTHKWEATVEFRVLDARKQSISLENLDPKKGNFVLRIFDDHNNVLGPEIALPHFELRTVSLERKQIKSQPFEVKSITKNGRYLFQIVAVDTGGPDVLSKPFPLEVNDFPAGASAERAGLTTDELEKFIRKTVKEECCPPPEPPEEEIVVEVGWSSGLIDPDLHVPHAGEMRVTKGGKLLDNENDIRHLDLVMKVIRSGRFETNADEKVNDMLNIARGLQYRSKNPDKHFHIIAIPHSTLKRWYESFGPELKLEPYAKRKDGSLESVGQPTDLTFGKESAFPKLPFAGPVLKTQLQRTNTKDEIHFTGLLWEAVKKRIPDFRDFDNLLNGVLGAYPTRPTGVRSQPAATATTNLGSSGPQSFHPLPFTNIQAYRLLKSAAQSYLWAINNAYTGQIDSYIASYGPDNDETLTPYNQKIMERLAEWRNDIVTANPDIAQNGNVFGIDHLPAVELIWSYWVEQGMMVQTINAVSMRFQNISTHPGTDPLAQIDIDPLRPLANLFWGYIQDEQHTLSIKRRAYEYDHTYGLQLEGKAVPAFKSVDSRSKFIEAFHNLLHSASIFFKESDDTTRYADAFVVLNNLREVHLLLAEGNHNAYGNLTWTARQEMMIQQYLLSRPEMREFLGGRIMVPYREGWMDRVDRMRQIQNWGSTSITHYYDLAQFGEVILLTIRAHDWSNEEDSNVAGSWATSFRNEMQRYIHSYRTVTGVDLSADAQLTEASFMQPSVLIQNRLRGEMRGPMRNGRIVGGSQPVRL